MTSAISKSTLRNYAACVILLFSTLWLFSRTLPNGFLDLDDPDYVSLNSHVLNGLTPAGVHWALTSGDFANWHPLTWLSLMFDAQLYGNFARGFHFTNNLLHALNAVLLFLLLIKITSLRPDGAKPSFDPFWPCVLCAALFAWHPLRVESVAWIAERKDVLSGSFFFLTLLAYAHYIEKTRTPNHKAALFYILALLGFAFGLMAKPMLVTLPFVLLLLDWWPFRRLDASTFRRLSVEKIPFFALAFASCIVTYLVQKNGGAVVESQSFAQRLANASISPIRYAGAFFWPANLAIVYPLPDHWRLLSVLSSGVLILAVTVLALRQSRRRPWLVVGWFWFLGMLVPVIGLVQVGLQAMADRYTYLPMLGLEFALIWTLAEFKWPVFLKTSAAALALLGCVWQTWWQIGFWRDPKTLYQHARDVTENNYLAECYLGTTLLNSDHFTGAAVHFQRAIRLKPDFNDARFKLGVALAKSGNAEGALAAYHDLLKINPRHALADYNIGILLLEQNHPHDAIPYFKATLQKKPSYDPALVALGTAEAKSSHSDAAINYFQKAILLRPENAVAHYNLANTLSDLHRVPEAISQYKKALQLDPDFEEAHGNYADALEASGRLADARTQYRQALALNPNNAASYFGLAVVFEDLDQISPATACYLRCASLDPSNAGVQYNLGTIYLNQNQPTNALAHFKAAIRIAPDNNAALLGAGLAREKLGQEDAAVADFRHAVQLAPDDAQAHCCLGIALRRTGKYSQAVAEDEIALKLNPKFPGLPEQLALAQRELAAANKP